MSSKPIFAIVGNKLDLVEKDGLDTSGINAIAEKYDIPFFLTSAKENIMIQEMFMDMVNQKIRQS